MKLLVNDKKFKIFLTAPSWVKSKKEIIMFVMSGMNIFSIIVNKNSFLSSMNVENILFNIHFFFNIHDNILCNLVVRLCIF